jgi:hypothetical protein
MASAGGTSNFKIMIGGLGVKVRARVRGQRLGIRD